ncbi:MAG: hypothetical protein II954_02385 [Synergistaceae bacterium]|nr:hypothetical protein [Synergistaceae bacterium]
MKRFLLKVSIFLIYAALWYTLFPMYIDPFNVFHADNIRANGVMPNKNYIKMKYILAHPDKFNTFLFGSSRTGAIHTDRIIGERCYNMLYSTGVPRWHLENIKTFFANKIYPDKIYIGVDSVSYTGNYAAQVNDPSRCPYEYLISHNIHFLKLYLDPVKVFQSLNTMLSALMGKVQVINTEAFYKYGWDIPYNHPSNIDWEDPAQVEPVFGYGKWDEGYRNYDVDIEDANISSNVDESIDYVLNILREISDICRKNNTELVIFTNPMHHVTYTASVREKKYFEFLEGLAEITDFWNFSSLNDITLSNDCYRETSHYKAKIGDLIIDIMCNGKTYPELQAQGFGVKVRRENVKDFLGMLKAQLTPEE